MDYDSHPMQEITVILITFLLPIALVYDITLS